MDLYQLKKTISPEDFERIKPCQNKLYTNCARMLLVDGEPIIKISRHYKTSRETINKYIIEFMLRTGGLEIDDSLNGLYSHVRYTPVFLG